MCVRDHLPDGLALGEALGEADGLALGLWLGEGDGLWLGEAVVTRRQIRKPACSLAQSDFHVSVSLMLMATPWGVPVPGELGHNGQPDSWTQ